VLGDSTLLNALASQALPLLHEFSPQELSNSAWSFARFEFQDAPLLHSIASKALKMITELSVQDMTNIPWALASLLVFDDPLLTAISEAALTNITGSGQALSAPMLLWTLWKTSFS
jgi:hypothetical protein